MKLSQVALVAATLLCGSPVLAAPLMTQPDLGRSTSPAVQVKVICHENGHCIRPAGRRPVARWVYGDTNFYGPYVGPGYYGNPRYRYNWFPFYYW